MKQRPDQFLSADKIDHDGEVFDYIKELHAYQWRVIRAVSPGANGSCTELIDAAIEKLEARARSDEMDEVCAKVCRGCMPWAPWHMSGVYTCQSRKAADLGHLFSELHPVCKDVVRREAAVPGSQERGNEMTKRTQAEIDEVIKQIKAQSDGSKFPGMTYEEGVFYALRWVTGESAIGPLEGGEVKEEPT